MCDQYWEKRGDQWILVLAEEDEIQTAKEMAEHEVDGFEFPPIKPVVEEPQQKRYPRTLTR